MSEIEVTRNGGWHCNGTTKSLHFVPDTEGHGLFVTINDMHETLEFKLDTATLRAFRQWLWPSENKEKLAEAQDRNTDEIVRDKLYNIRKQIHLARQLLTAIQAIARKEGYEGLEWLADHAENYLDDSDL
jgi:hypothetical protein